MLRLLPALATFVCVWPACGYDQHLPSTNRSAEHPGALGNGLIEGTEQCDDGNQAAGDGCSPTMSVEAGWSCTGEPSACARTCDNGVLDPGEECDQAHLNGETCQSLGFFAGSLRCDTDCAFDTSDCRMTGCGNGALDPGEECDDGNVLSGDGCSATCDAEQPACGNSILEQGEQCDGTDHGGADCLSLGYLWGVLQCTPMCQLDVSACVAPPECGDGVVNPGEDCDSDNYNGQTCLTLGYAAGELSCSPSCHFDDSACELSSCGNSTLEPGEQCDDGNLASGDGCDASCLIEGPCNGGTYQGNYTIHTDQDLQSFQSYVGIDGDLQIHPTAASAIDLPCLTSVNGTISVTSNTLVSLAMDSLTHIEYDLLITANPLLEWLSLPLLEGLPGHWAISVWGGSLIVTGNPSLTVLSLPSATGVAGFFRVEACHALEVIDMPLLGGSGRDFEIIDTAVSELRFPSVAGVGGNLRITDTNSAYTGAALTVISFPMLQHVYSNVYGDFGIDISRNDSLVYFDFPMLTGLLLDNHISHNPALIGFNLNAASGNTTVIHWNPSLIDIHGLGATIGTFVMGLSVAFNASLPDCDVWAYCGPSLGDCAASGSNSTAACGTCGNGVVESGESCDGTDLGGFTCPGLGFAGGTLACRANCSFDASGCTI